MRMPSPDQPRCSWCDQRCRNQADLIAHQATHRKQYPSAEELADGLARAAEIGLQGDKSEAA
jgi:hypothetical protein